MVKTPQEKTSVKKWIFRIVLVVLGTPLLIGFLYLLYMYYNPQLRIDFKEFKPTTLPAGTAITSEELEVWTAHPLLWFAPYGITVNMRLNNKGYFYIAESKDNGKYIDYSCGAGYVDTKCAELKTPGAQDYHQTLFYNPTDLQKTPLTYDKLTSQEIVFIKDGTRVVMNLQVKDNKQIPDTDIQTMIDSFAPTHFTNLQIKRYHPGP